LGGNSVWWTWTAPDYGSVTINTDGSAFDTFLGVYTGTQVTALSQFAYNDNYAGGIGGSSRVSFNTTVGTNYQIGVSGVFGVSSNITLHLNFAPLVPPRLIITPAGASIILSWPTNSASFTLQSTTNLGSPITWLPVSPPPVIANGQNMVTNSLPDIRRFYRLKLQP